MKKIFSVVLSLLFVSLLVACNDPVVLNEKITLPNLAGKERGEVVSELSGLQLEYNFDDTVAFNIPEGKFVEYSDGLRAGGEVDKDSRIVIYFSIHKNILPDLKGLTQNQVFQALNKLKLDGIDVRYIESDTIDAGLFSHYGGGLNAGSEVPLNSEVVIFIAQESLSNQKVFISKYMQGFVDSKFNNAIEIYNDKDESIDLSRYLLDIYLNGSSRVTHSIALTGNLNPGETYLVVHSEATTEVKDIADLVTSDLIFDGDDFIALAYKDHRVLDVVGRYEQQLRILDNRVIVRNSTAKFATQEFILTEWDIYANNYSDVFGSHPVLYPETFEFNKDHLAINYFVAKTGAVRVDFISNNDGDTGRFKIYDTKENMDNSVRFVGIDTEETNDPDPIKRMLSAQAQQYVEGLLSNAKEIYIQWDPSTGLNETYGRYLGLIWADGFLVNYGVVLNGYSQNMYSDPTHQMVYEGVPLHQWFINAENHAKAHNLGIWPYR